ncbi:MAG: N-6 DNA methylase, partial [Methanobrevibacter sp.]|nr:N-6 DNA methylase [Methanobrevibacter sp.]
NFDIFAESTSKKGTTQVDDEFLKEINKWREILAKKIAIRNKYITLSQLNFAVQQTIDRILFLRISEDKGIEPYEQLKNLLKHENIYEQFGKLCKKSDNKYNAGIFHFKDEKDINLEPDKFTLDLTIDNGVFKEIFQDIYYPKSPYEFSVISPEILGNVYEQFLGKIIRFTPSKQVKIEEKPEIKKAGGVFYTPQYIVDFIVENTVGKLCKEKTPKQVKELKILDPSCGSGSFLLGVYRYLLQWHIDYYSNLKQTPKDAVYTGKNGELHLTIQKKKEILINNIYGVDIDSQAVEVTKLSLLLKVLEDENKDALQAQKKLFNERILPFLGDNIKCGNSLIATDIITKQKGTKFEVTPNEIPKINPFNWEDEFKDVMTNGGFDCVVGNPPYFNLDTFGKKSKDVEYLKNNYEVYMDKTDILFYFIEKSTKLSKNLVGFIISNAFLFADKGKNLRNIIIEKNPISKIVNFEKFRVFDKANITTSIAIFDKTKTTKDNNSKDNSTKFLSLKDTNYEKQELLTLLNNENNYSKTYFDKNEVFSLIDNETKNLNNKIDSNHPKLGNLLLIGQGMQTAANNIFLFRKYPNEFPKEFIKRRIGGKNIDKYNINNKTDYILYFEFIDDFKKLPESIQNYLNENRKTLKNRADKKRRATAPWWNYTFALHKEYYDLPKIFCSYRSKENIFALDDDFTYLGLTNTTVIFGTNEKYSLKYILTLLNSKLLTFRYKSIGKQTGSGVYEYFANGISKLPISEISSEEQESFIELCDEMIKLKKDLAISKTPHEKKLINIQIEAIDMEIDQKIYKLYGLNNKEIATIENFDK